MHSTTSAQSNKERIEALLEHDPYLTNAVLRQTTKLSESTVNMYAKPWRRQRGIVSYQARQLHLEALLTEDPSRDDAALQRLTGYSLEACKKYAAIWRAAHQIAPPPKPTRPEAEKKVYTRLPISKAKHPPHITSEQRAWHLDQFHRLPDLAQRCMFMWIDQAIVASEYLEERNAYALRRDFIDSAGFAIAESAFCGALLARGHDPRDGSAPHWQFYIQRKAKNLQEPQSYIPPGRDARFEAMCDLVDRYVDTHGLLYAYEGEECESESAATSSTLDC